jgi:hypothetical protein
MRSRDVAVCLLVAVLVPEAALAEDVPPDAAVAVPPAAPRPAPVLPAILVPDLRPRIYVKDLDHLAELLKEDAPLQAKARDLSTRRTNALTVGGVLLSAGVLVAVMGATHETCDSEPAGRPPAQQIQVCTPNVGLLVAGSVISMSGVLAAMLMSPKHDDLLDVVNAWNASHPDRPFELYGSHRGVLVDQVAAPAAP